jgi:glutathione S-transferase
MSMTLYDLAGADERVRFSPYCWRVHLALKHKGLEAETVAWRFTDKEAIAFSGQGLAPVLMDGETTVYDSWNIVNHLEAAHQHLPSLFGGADAHAQAIFVKHWCELTLHPLLLKLILLDIFAVIHDKDKAYFRKTREARFGRTLEQFIDPPHIGLASLRDALAPLRASLKRQPYLGGERPMFVDYMVFAHFQCARVVSSLCLLEPDDPVWAWHERLLDAFNGFARRASVAPR